MMAVCRWDHVAVVGHSFVHWLDHFVREDGADSRFGLKECQVSFFGKRGGKIRDVHGQIESWRVPVNSIKAVVLICGDNDVKQCCLDDKSDHCEQIVKDILNTARELKRWLLFVS